MNKALSNRMPKSELVQKDSIILKNIEKRLEDSERNKMADNLLLRMSKQGIQLFMNIVSEYLLSMRITQERLCRNYDKEEKIPMWFL